MYSPQRKKKRKRDHSLYLITKLSEGDMADIIRHGSVFILIFDEKETLGLVFTINYAIAVQFPILKVRFDSIYKF